ncbi:MAG: alpha/beta hydrolase [Planctomycetota bacterium]
MNQDPSTRSRSPRWGLAVALVGVLALGLLAPGCTSLSKGDLEAELLALPKNDALRDLGLQRGKLQLTGEELEFVYARVPALEPAAGAAPAVLVHGTPSTLFTWTEIACGGGAFAGLARERDVYLIEVLGHGLAPSGPTPTTFQRCADYVAAAVRALGLERVHLVGQSYGGEFAWRAALDHPELFESLTIMSSSGYERRDEDWLPEEVEMRENSLADYGYLINSRERVAGALAPHFRAIPPDRVDEFFLVCENRSNWCAMIDLAQDENGERQDELPSLAVPTLLVWGAEDVAYWPDVYAASFARDIPGAELVLVPGAGHYPHEEQPAEVVRLLGDFFAREERRP